MNVNVMSPVGMPLYLTKIEHFRNLFPTSAPTTNDPGYNYRTDLWPCLMLNPKQFLLIIVEMDENHEKAKVNS